MGDTLLARSAALARQIAHKVQCQQAFDQANGGEDDGVRQDDLKGLPRQRHHGDVQARQSALDRSQITHPRHVEAETNHQSGDDPDARKRRGDQFGNARGDPDDRHGCRHQRQHQVERLARKPFATTHAVAGIDHGAGHFELAHLGEENHDGKSVDETQHHRMRHQPDEFAPLHDPCEDLQKPHQHHGGKEVFNPMLRHQGHHDHRQCACGARDHTRPTSD